MKYLFFLFTLSFCSCYTNSKFNKVTIPKGTILTQAGYKYAQAGNPDSILEGTRLYELNVFETAKDLDGVVKVEEEKIRISIHSKKQDVLIPKQTVKGILIEKETDYRLPYKYEYDGKLGTMVNKAFLMDTSSFLDDYALGSSFSYQSDAIVFQSITIPIKLRPNLGKVPYEVSTGVNVGFGIGKRWNYNRVEPIYNIPNNKMAGYFDNQFSFSLALFTGFTTIKLTPANTNEMVLKEKTVLGLDFGISSAIGINKLNLGLAVGYDAGFGKEAGYWLYQVRPWFGFVVGLELVK